MSVRRGFAAAALVPLALMGCRKAELAGRPQDGGPASRKTAAAAESQAPAGAARVVYVAKDYAFEGPDRLPAGLTTIELRNEGREPHHLILVRLGAGKSQADFLEAMRSAGPEAQPPAWATLEGGPNAVAQGGTANATLVLEPGTYAVICVIPAADGIAHVAKGMAKTVLVTGHAREAEEPAADLTIELVDYDFRLPATVKAGAHTIRVENEGSEPHELVLWQLAPGKTMGDLVAWAEGGMKSAPPALPIGGISPLRAGGEETFTADLRAGDYALLCFLPDDEDGRPHIEHGMAKQITVSG